MAISRQQLLLGLALLITLLLTWKTANEDSAEPVMPTRVLSNNQDGIQAPALQGASTSAFQSIVLMSRPVVAMQADLFSAPIKPAPVRAAARKASPPPSPKIAPPLPFRYLGRWQVGDSQVLSLDYRGEVLTVQAGDTVAEQYKLMAISDNPLQAQFLYIPFNQMQVMHIGATP